MCAGKCCCELLYSKQQLQQHCAGPAHHQLQSMVEISHTPDVYVGGWPVAQTNLCMVAGAQCAHAAVGVIGAYKSGNEALFRQWERHGQPKIALKIKDDQEMVSAGGQRWGAARPQVLCASPAAACAGQGISDL